MHGPRSDTKVVGTMHDDKCSSDNEKEKCKRDVVAMKEK